MKTWKTGFLAGVMVTAGVVACTGAAVQKDKSLELYRTACLGLQAESRAMPEHAGSGEDAKYDNAKAKYNHWLNVLDSYTPEDFR